MAKKVFMLMILMWAVMFLAPEVYAITAPATGTFAYDVYKIAVLDILKGPIGFVSGAAAIVLGAVSAITGRIMTAIPCILGGGVIIKADTITTSLGLIF